MAELTNVQFLTSLDLIRRWNEFSDAWNKVRQGFSEPSIHDFRVAIRRLIAGLEFASALTHAEETDSSIRKFRKALRRFGPLRDIQVHLLRAESENMEWTWQFSEFLKQREKEEIQVLRKWMREKKKETFHRRVWKSNQTLQAASTGPMRPDIRAAMDGALRKRCDALTAAYACFGNGGSARDFHRMRIKFKRFRYAAEIAKPVLGVFAKKQMDRIRELQKIMGEIHDLQTFMETFLQWSGTHVPGRLQKEYDALMKAFNDSQGKFEEFTFQTRPKLRTPVL